MNQFFKCMNGNDNSKSHSISDGNHIFIRRNILEFLSPFVVEDDTINKKTKISIDHDGALDLERFEPPRNVSSGISKIINLEDIGITNPIDGQILTFNGNTNQWENKNLQLRIYSTTEHLIGYWTDNKPIYEKTINNLNISIQQSSGWKQIIDTSNINIDTLVNIQFKRDATLICNFYEIRINTSTNYLEVYPSINSTETSIIVIKEITMQYTKNTVS